MGNIYDQVIEKQTTLVEAEYEACTFLNCDFSNADFSNYVFFECEFKNCNLSLTLVGNTAFRDVKFIDCKLVGVRFDAANDWLFSVRFENCLLNYASFYKKNMKKTVFKSCNIEEADFSEAVLTEAVFADANLARAVFFQTNLEKANFTTAKNYHLINPAENYLKKAKFSMHGVLGLLAPFGIEIE